MTIGGGGEKRRRFSSARDVLVDGAVMHLVGVGKTFGMSARVVGKSGDIFAEAGGAALEDLIRLVAPSDEDLVGLLEAPANARDGAEEPE
jgi:hypothetical protein